MKQQKLTLRSVLSISFILILASCSEGNLPDVTTYTSGYYGSEKGRFMIKFPRKPDVLTQHYQLGSTIEFDSYIFRYNLANSEVYTLTYVDYPKNVLKTWEVEEFFDQSIKSMGAEIGDVKINSKRIGTDIGFEKSIYYDLYYPSNGATMTAKLLKHKNRVYYITLISLKQQSDERVDNFINSFSVF